ncbi:MAG TPA: hypothetical protein VF488_02320 [Gemmatimonadaceae bacterium]
MTVDRNAEVRSLVAPLLAERAITLANARGQADAAQDELYKWRSARAMDCERTCGHFPTELMSRRRARGWRPAPTWASRRWERDAPYPLTVIRMSSWPTEQEARDDALARGNQDAATACGSFRYTSDVVSASVEPVAPGNWKCTETDHRIACGFVGKVVCRVRDHLVSQQERCRE